MGEERRKGCTKFLGFIACSTGKHNIHCNHGVTGNPPHQIHDSHTKCFRIQHLGLNGRGRKSQRQLWRGKESSPFASAIERVNLIDEMDYETLASSDSSAFDRVPTSHHENRRAKEKPETTPRS